MNKHGHNLVAHRSTRNWSYWRIHTIKWRGGGVNRWVRTVFLLFREENTKHEKKKKHSGKRKQTQRGGLDSLQRKVRYLYFTLSSYVVAYCL